MSAEAPGTAVAAWPAAIASTASRQPGSATSGVPASETSATERPAASAASRRGRCAGPLWSW